MTTPKSILALVLAVIIGGFVYGAYQYPQVQMFAAASPAGTTVNTEKFAGILGISLASPGIAGASGSTANGTSTSILNTDAFDRYATSWVAACEGVGTSKTAYTGGGLASLQISVGTTTTASPATFLSAEAIASAQNIATTTVNLLVSSSTLQSATSSLAMVWPANTYMTFAFNATNTAVCTLGIRYAQS